MIEPCNFEDLPDQSGEVADPEFSALIFQLLGNRDERTKSHAAYVCQIPEVDDQASKTI